MKTPCYVYIIHQTTTNYIKIGIADNPKNRLKELQTASPLPLHLKFTLSCQDRNAAIAIESGLHQHYEKQRMSGEWFDIPVEQIVDILKTAAFLAKHLQPVIEIVDTKTVEIEKPVKVIEIKTIEIEKPVYIEVAKKPKIPMTLMSLVAVVGYVIVWSKVVEHQPILPFLPEWSYSSIGFLTAMLLFMILIVALEQRKIDNQR
jgi:predicted GIY-YIG superfamily endonuclease